MSSDAGSGDLASMETTAGSTLSITDSMSVVPLRRAGPAEISFTVVPRAVVAGGRDDPPADQGADQGGDQDDRPPTATRTASGRADARRPRHRSAGGRRAPARGRPGSRRLAAGQRGRGRPSPPVPGPTRSDGVGTELLPRRSGRKGSPGHRGWSAPGRRRPGGRPPPLPGRRSPTCSIVCPSNHGRPPVCLVRGRTTVRSCRAMVRRPAPLKPAFQGFLLAS